MTRAACCFFIVFTFLLLTVLAGCTAKGKTEAATLPKASDPVVSDPTPPELPNSVQIAASDLQRMPAFLTLAVGGIADEGEKEGIQVQENLRVFRTDTGAAEIAAFYSRELKQRGWTTDNQVAHSPSTGLNIQEYRHNRSEILYVIISEPEEPTSGDDAKNKRHVALLPAIVKSK